MSYEARNDNYIRDVSQEVNEAVAFCSMQCHCGGGTQYNVTLRCFDGFRKNKDGNIEYKPTAEWQRIQTELQQGREAVEKLQRFDDGIPKTKDGVFIIPNREYWYRNFYGEVLQVNVYMVRNDEEGYVIYLEFGSEYFEETPDQLFSTQEACLSSIKEQRESK